VNDDAYIPIGENVNVNPEVSTMNIVQLTLVLREAKKKDDRQIELREVVPI